MTSQISQATDECTFRQTDKQTGKQQSLSIAFWCKEPDSTENN